MADQSDLVAFDLKSAKRIAAAVKRLEGTPQGKPGRERNWPGTLGRDRWFGVTATCAEFPTYPTGPTTSTADTYCVRLIERFFTETPGTQVQTELQDNRYVVARLACPTAIPGADARWIQEGTEVEVYRLPTRRGSRYWFRPLDEQERLFELTSRLYCGSTASAQLCLGAGGLPVAGVMFTVVDPANLVGNLTGGGEFAEAGVRGIAKWFHDRGSWDVIAIGKCAGEGECSFTGAVTVGKGNLTGGCDSVCEDQLTLTFEDGRLCSSAEAGQVCATVTGPSVLAGSCIGVVQGVDGSSGCVTFTVSNTMALTAGTCISVEGEGCEKTISNTMQIAAGDCISVAGEGCTRTIANTMKVVGGNGITVQKNGCTYSVGLNGGEADPKTTLRFLCGVEISPITISCVDDGYGNFTLSVSGGVVTEKFTTLSLPAAIVSDLVSECTDPPVEPPEECEDCPECEEGEVNTFNPGTSECGCEVLTSPPAALGAGWIYCDTTIACGQVNDCETYQNRIYNPTTGEFACQGPWQPLPDGWIYCETPNGAGEKIIMEVGTGVCDCIAVGDVVPAGWIECTDDPISPAGSGLQINGMDCSGAIPHVSFTFLGMPTGAVSYTIYAVGSLGGSATIGPSVDGEEIVGQEYWGALLDEWGTPEYGEQYTFSVVFKDGSGNVVASQTFTASCNV